MSAVENFLDTFETCHICQGQLALDDIEPVHCENCSGDCDAHDEPNCTPIFHLHGQARIEYRTLLEPAVLVLAALYRHNRETGSWLVPPDIQDRIKELMK